MNNYRNTGNSEQIALEVMRVVEKLPKDYLSELMGKQLLRAGLSFDANYRAVRRSKSSADALDRMRVVEKEADDLLYWLETVISSEFMSKSDFSPLKKGVTEIIDMTINSVKDIRSKIPIQQT